MTLSVIVCTHNPRAAFISRVMEGLRHQTLPTSDWELLLIDNASTNPLAGQLDISWHPAGRHILESELGLTPARLRGIGESQGGLIVFVDDDNVLDPDYLRNALDIAGRFPFLGTWGASITGDFEVPVPAFAKSSLQLLAIKETEEEVWSNHMRFFYSHPCGAGLCVRRDVALLYARLVIETPERKMLDRRGNSLASAGDVDLIFTAGDLGLGWGVFPQLKLRHLIPKERLTRAYFKRLNYSGTQSWNLLLHGRNLPLEYPMSLPKRLAKAAFTALRRGPFAAEMFWIQQRGLAKSAEDLSPTRTH